MNEQQKNLIELFAVMSEQDGITPKELEPREKEIYRYAWRIKNLHETYFEIVQIGKCLYFTAETKSYSENEELKILQLLNHLNGWTHYGIFTYSEEEKLIMYEQTHFCRKFCYDKNDVYDFIIGMTKRIGLFYTSADLVFNQGMPIPTAVNNANIGLEEYRG